ncbi:MAG: PAS domain S-box protein [Woeseiaceae bacterium]
MIIDIVLVTTTLAIAALISFALWRAFRRESGQTRRIVGLALGGAASITLAKLVQLVVLTSAADAGGDAMIARYVDVGSTIVVAIGMALLAASLLDMVMFGRSMWPHGDLSHAAAVPGEEAILKPELVPAILYRRAAPLGDTTVCNVFLNNKPEDILGFTQEEMQSDPHFVTWLMHPEDRQDLAAADQLLEAEKSDAVFDQRYKHRSGSYRWVRTSMKRIEDENGTFKGIIGCGLDVTDLKEAEQQLISILNTDPCSVIPEDEVI